MSTFTLLLDILVPQARFLNFSRLWMGSIKVLSSLRRR
jgi:hypothetical protein